MWLGGEGSAHQYFIACASLQGAQTGSVAVAAYGIERKVELSRRKHDSMSDAEEGETWEQVICMLCVKCTIIILLL